MKTKQPSWFGLSWRLLWSAGFGVLLLMLAAALNFSLASAQGPITPRHTDPFWQASYWNNPSLSGPPALTRQDRDLDFTWGYGSPDSRIQSDHFSARWQRYIDTPAGAYLFEASADDGVRVRVDGRLIIDGWKEQGPTRYQAVINLSAGHHLVEVDYFESTGWAALSVSWRQAPEPAGWKGEYFNNMSLSGTPVVVRTDPAVDFDWRYASPAPGVDPDGFSVRWTRNLDLPAGRYRFTTTVDDGVRLFVNGHTLIDAWKVQALTTYSGDIYLPGGSVTVQMEYFENTERAAAHLRWESIGEGPGPTATATPTFTPTPGPTATPSPTPTPSSGVWHAQYWNNRTFSGFPVLVRREDAIDHNWGEGSPEEMIVNRDNFSARWTATFYPAAGSYVFDVISDDGVRVYVNDKRVIDAWQDQGPTEYSVVVNHSGGALRVMVEYYEHIGSALIKLTWGPAPGPSPTPTATPSPVSADVVLIDELDPGFVKGGQASSWGEAQEGFNGHLFWTQNNDKVYSGYNWGQWRPKLAAGRYEVLVYIPDRYTTSAKARYWISHAGGYTLRIIDQSRYHDEWVSLGTYRFRGDNRDYVSLADVTGEPRLTRLLAWDAAKWVKR